MEIIKYEIIAYSKDQDILYHVHGTRHEYGIPHILLEQIGKQYAPCYVTYKNLTHGWRAEKSFE